MVREDDAGPGVHVPVRTCVGCRERAAKHELLRVVVRHAGGGPTVVPDPEGTQPGRGAYLHPRLECLEQAVRRRAFGRALRVPTAPDASSLEEHLRLVRQTVTSRREVHEGQAPPGPRS